MHFWQFCFVACCYFSALWTQNERLGVKSRFVLFLRVFRVANTGVSEKTTTSCLAHVHLIPIGLKDLFRSIVYRVFILFLNFFFHILKLFSGRVATDQDR